MYHLKTVWNQAVFLLLFFKEGRDWDHILEKMGNHSFISRSSRRQEVVLAEIFISGQEDGSAGEGSSHQA